MEILPEAKLPIKFTANTCCFRSEAGSAGKDTKGVIRQHQFYKTEMVILSNPANSYEQHEFMTRQAEKLLEYDNAVILFMSSKEIYILEQEYMEKLGEKLNLEDK